MAFSEERRGEEEGDYYCQRRQEEKEILILHPEVPAHVSRHAPIPLPAPAGGRSNAQSVCPLPMIIEGG